MNLDPRLNETHLAHWNGAGEDVGVGYGKYGPMSLIFRVYVR